MPSPVQSNCDAHDTIENGSTVLSGQWDTHNRQQETDLPPAELWCACSLLIGRYITSSAGVVLLTRPPRAVYYTFQ
ncbi:hypothetical protein TNCV_4152681 [Trichonephila clavipes]|nr:hypothetical protein TNCV_4152681 [Trichonephila clavipes]